MSSCGSNAVPWGRWRMSICSFRREMELTGRLSPWYTPRHLLALSSCIRLWLQLLAADCWDGGGMVLLEHILRASFHGPRPAASVHGQGRAFAQRNGAVFLRIFLPSFGFYRRFPSDLLADPTFVTVLLTVSETLLGFVFLFFLGLGLRTRFRLR